MTGSGDKPGIDIVLTEKAGKVISGRLRIANPENPRDPSRGEIYSLKIVDQHDRVVRAETSLIDGSPRRWTEDIHVTIALKGPFEGDRVQADVQERDGGKQAAVFVRNVAKRPSQGGSDKRG